ncbi:molybdate ABC transporter substrate-binding protein [Cryobacterium algoritolerans]|uniref:Molybdate ABC transporter substrate-binding protein n=1 Tax=Cryobacterium algoritolerans TaxID=1259184 RepID=A0A4V3IF41_9MICO|nr:molybdate ABC transporter substrate-binding protein [Cryobacterium algoritolerans]TFC16301.1 molybdate ABC transporter substrate-binding protein [Cryobacterium algoritolerans]
MFVLVLAAGLTAGCAGQAGTSAGPDPATASADTAVPAAPQTLTVFAAASLTGTFRALADRFEAAHPGVTVTLNFAGSADLVTQITEGAPADVFAAADTKNMARLRDAGLVAGDPSVFATNTLEIAVPPGNPAGISSFADLARPGVAVVTCAPQVPCGAAAAKIQADIGVTLSPVSEENAVTDVLGKVSSGEADAGLVYVTDVAAAGTSVRGIPFPESDRAVNSYPIGVVAGSPHARLGASFARFVTGAAGQKVLAAAGFGAP